MVKDTKLYDLLGVASDADASQLKKAYFRLAQKFNPNLPENKEKFQEINNAYELLKDAQRALYDKYGLNDMGKAQQVPGDIGSVFEEILKKQSQQHGPKQAQVLVQEVWVTLEQMYNGADVSVQITRQIKCAECKGVGGSTPNCVGKCDQCNGMGIVLARMQQGGRIIQQQIVCPKCNGEKECVKNQKDLCQKCCGKRVSTEQKTHQVRVEPGTADGQQLTLFQEGNWEPGAQGDCVIVFKQTKSTFRREEADLFTTKEIGLDEAVCGTSFKIQHLSGEEITVFNGECIGHGQVMCCKGLGMPVKGRIYEHGNLFVTFEVKFPQKISLEVRRLIANALGSEDSRKRINACAELKHDGARNIELTYVDPTQKTKNADSSGQQEYNDHREEGNTQEMQCGAM
ncbi:Chaperone_protein DnaJ subfamily A [Hexamita inflata]|uniref:Chaperone protein DnaJ subfamily A n=1 Tax=Hexamita inflata TaxID=28002 RepID=A0AA86UQY1_9EUKA|nr:Chaperone protein DnaJ subfamily A [Hexamita inflata]